MAKVLWAADRRVTKDDGTPASTGTLTIRLADTSTTATAYTDRALSTEQSVFTIGSDGYLQNRPTIYGADDVGYDAYVSSTGVNGSVAWTIPDLSIAETAVSDVTDSAQAFKNLIANGAFDVWGSTTTWSNISGDNDGDETALGWFFAQPSAASNAVSRQTALRTGARYGLRFGRPAASASTNKLRIWGMLPTEAAIRARGQIVTISFNAHKGANFSGGSLAVKLATGTAAAEDGDNIESGGFTGHANPLNTAQSIDTATARYEFQATIGATVSELGFQFSYTPAGTAGADDWVQIEDVQIEVAATATAFASVPEPISFLIEELTSVGRQLLQTSALGGALSLSGTTLQVTAAAILAQLLTVDGASSGLDADLLDGVNIGTSGDTIPKNNTANTFSAAQTFANVVNTFGSIAGASLSHVLSAAAGTTRNITYQSAGVDRWHLRVNNAAESGSNVGSDFEIISRTDAGGSLLTALSIARSTGISTFGAAVLVPAGSAAAPSVGFSADPNTGMYNPSADQVAFAAGGTQTLNMGTTFATFGVRAYAVDGAAGTPGWSFASDTDTGMLRIGANQGGFAAGGATVSKYDSAGHRDASDNLWQVGGKHLIPLRAAAFTAQTTNGAAAYSAELATNDQMITGFAFDAATDEFIQLEIPMPKSWNEGTFTARFRWYAPSGTGNVVWGIQALCVGDDDAIDAAWGTAQTVTDALTATGDLMVTAETAAVTAAGSPAEGDTLILRVYRDADNGSDTFSADAILLGVDLFVSISGSNDA